MPCERVALGGGTAWQEIPLMQLKSPGEAGRLPHTELLPFNTTPSGGWGVREWSMEGKGWARERWGLGCGI